MLGAVAFVLRIEGDEIDALVPCMATRWVEVVAGMEDGSSHHHARIPADILCGGRLQQ